jgi:hypothetical protein
LLQRHLEHDCLLCFLIFLAIWFPKQQHALDVSVQLHGLQCDLM